MPGVLDGTNSIGVPVWPTNSLIGPAGSITTSATPGINTLRIAPVYIPNGIRLTGIIVETTTASDAGGVIRLGVWASAANGTPTGPSLTGINGTTVAADGATGFLESTVSVVLNAGIYWFGASLETATTQPTIRNQGAGNFAFPVPAAIALNAGYSVSGVPAGTLPTLIGIALAVASNVYHFTYRTGTI